MQRWRRVWGSLWLLVAFVALTVVLSGCGDDLYAKCDLDSSNRCGEESSSVSCVEEDNTQCDTQVCAKYKGGEPFCTVTCESDEDCTAGVCRQFPYGSSTSYCVESNDAN